VRETREQKWYASLVEDVGSTGKRKAAPEQLTCHGTNSDGYTCFLVPERLAVVTDAANFARTETLGTRL